jgi:hypothetical protein
MYSNNHGDAVIIKVDHILRMVVLLSSLQERVRR